MTAKKKPPKLARRGFLGGQPSGVWWAKVDGKTCNTHRVMKGPVGISLDDCKKEAAKVSAPAFSWGATKWCLLCKVDAGGNYLDDKDEVIAWDSSSTYDLYNRNQAGAATTATPSSKTVWAKVDGKTCNTHRVMKGPVGISLDDCKKEAAKVSAPAFSWGATKWCLLCKVDAGGNYLDDKDKVIAWDSSSTYDPYNRNQAGAA